MYSDQPTRPVAYRYHRPNDQKGRRGCGCLSRLLFGGIILLALIIFTGAIIGSPEIAKNIFNSPEFAFKGSVMYGTGKVTLRLWCLA